MRRHQSKRPSRSLAESTSWFNNAGNFFAGFFEEQRSEQVRNQIETLLFGPMNVTRAVLPVMRKQRSGLLITISSTAGIAGQMLCRTPRQARHSCLSADRATYMPPRPPRARQGTQAWCTFVRNHAQSVLASDFFVLVTVTFRVIYVLSSWKSVPDESCIGP